VISKKAIIAGVLSAIVSVGMLAMPSRALAHDWNHDGDWHHAQHDDGWHHDNDGRSDWFNQHRWGEEHQRYQQPYAQQPYANRYGYGQPNNPGYGWNAPAYNYNQRGYGNYYNQPLYGSNSYRRNIPANGQGMIDPRHPGLMWTCDSDGHHCHWGRRPGYGSNYPQTGLNPYAYGNGYNGYNRNGYYGNNGNYANGYYGNSPDALGSMLGPLFGGQR
jgi:hypothetical protein